MLVKLRTTVVSDWTTEVESRAEAEAKRAALEADEQSHCHHGERVTVEIVPIVEPGGRVRFCEWMTGPTDMHGRHTLRVKSTGYRFGDFRGEEPGIAIVRVYLEVGYEDVEVPIECMEPSAPGTVG